MSRMKKGMRFGNLTFTGISSGIVHVCRCDCGNEVFRTDAGLRTRKLQRCPSCRAERVEEELERKKIERNKHAYRESADQARP